MTPSTHGKIARVSFLLLRWSAGHSVIIFELFELRAMQCTDTHSGLYYDEVSTALATATAPRVLDPHWGRPTYGGRSMWPSPGAGAGDGPARELKHWVSKLSEMARSQNISRRLSGPPPPLGAKGAQTTMAPRNPGCHVTTASSRVQRR